MAINKLCYVLFVVASIFLVDIIHDRDVVQNVTIFDFCAVNQNDQKSL